MSHKNVMLVKGAPAILAMALCLSLYSQAPPRPFLVVLDPAHGGTDAGAQLAPDLAEKNFTVSFARKLTAELRSRGINTRQLRDSDVTLTPEQRAADASWPRPALYLSIHATSGSAPLRIYTAELAPTHDRNAFLPWHSAQSAWLRESQALAANFASIANAEGERAEVRAVKINTLPNISAPAVAVEIAASGAETSEDQQKLVNILADAILKQRDGKL